MSVSIALRQEKLLRLYQRDPHLYAQQVLKSIWTEDAKEVARLLFDPNGKRAVAWPAGHSVSKTYTAACLANYFYDCFDPGIVITTAPTERQVFSLWREIRDLRGDDPNFYETASKLDDTNKHWAAGYTAGTDVAFQGEHSENMLMIFDEAVGIHSRFYSAAAGMLTAENNFLLLLYNPTDPSCQAYIEEHGGMYDVVRSSALDHPNIERQLRGEAPLIPAAATLGWVEERISAWCERTDEPDPLRNDFEFPPGSGIWYTPNGEFEARCMGIWPSQGADSVWSETAWKLCLIRQEVKDDKPTEIGCDVARFGDDNTAIHGRRGNCSLHHERHNGWPIPRTAERIKEVCREIASEGEDPKTILCKIDDTGVGGGVTDLAGGYNFVGINSICNAGNDDYPNIRSELWFDSATRAKDKLLDVSRIRKDNRDRIGMQCKLCRWKMDGQGRRVVERKEDMKKRLKDSRGKRISPDDADAFNLAYYIPPVKRQVGFAIY